MLPLSEGSPGGSLKSPRQKKGLPLPPKESRSQSLNSWPTRALRQLREKRTICTSRPYLQQRNDCKLARGRALPTLVTNAYISMRAQSAFLHYCCRWRAAYPAQGGNKRRSSRHGRDLIHRPLNPEGLQDTHSPRPVVQPNLTHLLV